ncbi:universal stress protein [Streptomyces sp. NPDC048566]|uniref:universal stress protein n=1 Tax=Streptomyces sp. NPDC048566 TaxID=3365569 RepID=UPI0037211F93
MVGDVTAGVDGSPESRAAVHWAAREALRRGAALRLVHACDPHPRTALSPRVGSRKEDEALELAALAHGLRAAHPGLSVVERCPDAAPVPALLAAADASDLLVLGSRGLSGLTGFVLGSIAQPVVARSSAPVVLVRAGAGDCVEHFTASDGVSPDEVPRLPYRDVVLGLDVDRPCDELIAFAFEAARLRGASLRVIHAFGAPHLSPSVEHLGRESGPEVLAGHESAVVAALRPWCEKYPQVPVAVTVVDGRPAAEVIRGSADAALLVVGRRRRRSRLGALLGPVAHAVLHHADTSVAVVPHD